MARTFAHQTVLDLAAHGSIPVINGLTDDLHPCQALADYFTLSEIFGGVDGLAGRKIAYVGDGNNMAHSLLHGARRRHGHQRGDARGLRGPGRVSGERPRDAEAAGTRVETTDDPRAAVAGASCVYTDVWASMGQEEEAAERLRAFAGFTVDAELMAAAPAMRSSCTACRLTGAKRSPPRSPTALRAASSIRPRIGCTCRRPSWSSSWAPGQ